MARKILKADVRFISLCRRGANRLPVMYKSIDSLPDDLRKAMGSVDRDRACFSMSLLTKGAMDDKGELLAVVYAPDLEDSQGDYADRDVIREAMHSAARNGLALDIHHDGQALGKDRAYVAESFEIMPNDPRFAGTTDDSGNPVDVTGGWGVLIKVTDPALREKYRNGEWSGVSMGGTYLPGPEEGLNKAEVGLLERLLKALVFPRSKHNPLIPETGHGDIEMTKEELQAILKESNEQLAKALVESLAPKKEGKADDGGKQEDTTKKPAYSGDPTDAKAIAEHLAKLQKEALSKSVDWSDPASVKEYLANVEKLAKDNADDEEALPADSRKGSSNLPVSDATWASMSKEERDCLRTANSLLDMVPSSRRVKTA